MGFKVSVQEVCTGPGPSKPCRSAGRSHRSDGRRRFHHTQDPGHRLAQWGATVGQRSVTMTRGGVPMPILELSDAQVVELVKQLPPERQRAALNAAHGFHRLFKYLMVA